MISYAIRRLFSVVLLVVFIVIGWNLHKGWVGLKSVFEARRERGTTMSIPVLDEVQENVGRVSVPIPSPVR